MNESKVHDIIIIGSGPAGLSLAYNLKKKGYHPFVVEKSDKTGASWWNMPKHLHLISCWKASSLDFNKDKFSNSPHQRVPANQFAKYLVDFAKENEIAIAHNTEVQGLTKNEFFELKTNQGILKGKTIVNASGYYNGPHIPEDMQKLLSSIPSTHFRNFKDVPSLGENVQKVLIVGKRISAGQVAGELLRENKTISFSTRGPVKFMSKPPMFTFFFKNVLLMDKLIFLLMGKNAKLDIPMEYDPLIESKIKSGEINVYPSAKECKEDGTVVFEDAREQKFDHIIYTTGFKQTFNHLSPASPFVVATGLRDCFEHPKLEGLYFLGLDQQRNFRSRFLRGMREDAAELANILIKRLG